jgi:hypothetical protein
MNIAPTYTSGWQDGKEEISKLSLFEIDPKDLNITHV